MLTASPPSSNTALPSLEATRAQWHRQGGDLWVFGYASLIWRPDFAFAERRRARVHGWHRALKMWSRVNRGTPQLPGLVFALLAGGSCQGVVFRIAQQQGDAVLTQLWQREMPLPVYDPRWLPCHTEAGPVPALAFTLTRRSPSYTGVLPDAEYQRIFAQAQGIYGSTHDYAEQTHQELLRMGIRDHALERLLSLAPPQPSAPD